MSYQEAENSSTPEKLVLPSRRVNVLAIYTESNQSWLAPWVAGILVEPVKTVYHCSGLRKCVFMVWFSNMARTLNCLHGETMFTGVEDSSGT